MRLSKDAPEHQTNSTTYFRTASNGHHSPLSHEEENESGQRRLSG